MKRIIFGTFLLCVFSLSCSLFQKEKKDNDSLGLLLLYVLSQDNGGCNGQKSGFTICIPKGIAE